MRNHRKSKVKGSKTGKTIISSGSGVSDLLEKQQLSIVVSARSSSC